LTSYYLAEPSSKLTHNLHDAEVRALKIIYSNGPLSMHQLSEAMYTSRPRGNQIVDSLLDKQLVDKVKGGDKRMTYV
ncbi:MarR family transcriptional regulator, partial [Escherichia coli]|uniref:MarR family transcriptional regulator n=1 Tax=Escherichia coli TaxID=562 RepID=UPI0021F2BD89